VDAGCAKNVPRPGAYQALELSAPPEAPR
jgi:hypothetical protein